MGNSKSDARVKLKTMANLEIARVMFTLRTMVILEIVRVMLQEL